MARGSGQRRREIGRIGLQDPGVGLHDLPERPERDAVAVWQASALSPDDEIRAVAGGGPGPEGGA